MKRSKNRLLHLEALEERCNPSFTFQYTPSNDTWTVTQVQNNGPATITVNAGTNQLSVADTAGAATVGVANGSLKLTMLSNTGNVSVALDAHLSGNVTINLANGARTLDFTGTDNTVGGNVNITAGTGAQSVELSTTDALVAGGSVSIDLGGDADDLSTTSGMVVGTSLTLRNVNDYADSAAGLTIGTNFTFTNTDNLDNSLLIGAGTVNIGGNVSYTGGSADELIEITDSTIGGSFIANLGTGLTGLTNIQDVDLSGSTIGLGVTVTSGLSTLDTFATDADTEIGGSIVLNLGNGNSNITLLGTSGGGSVNITGGINSDNVTYAMTGGQARVTANLGAGTDTFTLDLDGGGNNPDLSYLSIDFGAGVDSFVSNYIGAYPFTVLLRNLP